MLWGPKLIHIHNDAYQPLLGEHYPWDLRRRPAIGGRKSGISMSPFITGVIDFGETVHYDDQEFVIGKSDFLKSGCVTTLV